MHYSEWRPESQITGIAWSWVGSATVHSRLLYQHLKNEDAMLLEFLTAYHAADIVTGHYIRKHDLPLLNDHCIRAGLAPLPSKLVQDTQTDLVKVKALGKSQENLAETFGLEADKYHMNGAKWRRANELGVAGQQETASRVVADVQQHKLLRAELLKRDLLRSPRRWSP